MEKILNTIEKISIKSRPAKYKNLKDTCKKLQAIIDRRVVNEKSGIIPTYKQELDFYKVFIPNINEEMKNYIGRIDRPQILKAKANKWVKSQLPVCAKYISVFGKGHLTDVMPVKGGKHSSPKRSSSSKKTKKSVKRTSLRKKATKTASIRKSSL